MMELTINGQVYEFNFGMRFLREINKTAKTSAGDVEKNIGFSYAVGGIIDNDPETLVDVLYAANVGQNPRVTKELLDSYIDDPDTDIDGLFEETMDFFGKTNATKMKTKKILEEVEKMKQAEEAKRMQGQA